MRWQLHDDPQRLNDAARAHLAERGEPLSRFRVGWKPVAGGKSDLDLREWKSQEGRHEPAAENRAPGMVTERARPPLPPLRGVDPSEHAREPLRPADVPSRDRERR